MGSHGQPTPEEFARLLELGYAPVIHSVFLAAVELKLFDIIEKAGDGARLSANEIASKLPKQTVDTAEVLDRMLQLLASQSILQCTLVSGDDGSSSKVYRLNSLSKFLAADENGLSLAPPLNGKAMRECCYSLKDAVLEGGIPFNKAHGMNLFEMLAINLTLSGTFNNGMRSRASFIMKEILRVYDGFGSVKKLVDVGGGLGSTINSVLSTYPHIQGINFDLPQVIEKAPTYAGVEHVAGDMFQEVPIADAIILKINIYLFSTYFMTGPMRLPSSCSKTVGNLCIELILPECPATDVVSRTAYTVDVLMHVVSDGGKERTLKQYENLAREAGFKSSKLVSRAYQYGVIEFYKD